MFVLRVESLLCFSQVRCAAFQPVLQDQACGDGPADPRMRGDPDQEGGYCRFWTVLMGRSSAHPASFSKTSTINSFIPSVLARQTSRVLYV